MVGKGKEKGARRTKVQCDEGGGGRGLLPEDAVEEEEKCEALECTRLAFCRVVYSYLARNYCIVLEWRMHV